MVLTDVTGVIEKEVPLVMPRCLDVGKVSVFKVGLISEKPDVREKSFTLIVVMNEDIGDEHIV